MIVQPSVVCLALGCDGLLHSLDPVDKAVDIRRRLGVLGDNPHSPGEEWVEVEPVSEHHEHLVHVPGARREHPSIYYNSKIYIVVLIYVCIADLLP